MKNDGVFEKMQNFFKKLFKKTDELLFPANIKCLGCGFDLPEKREIEFCDECLKNVEYITEEKCCSLCGTSLKIKNICSHCKEHKREFDMARSVCKYNDFMANMITKFKYHNHPYMANTFAHMLTKKFKEMNILPDYVIPVPITKKREKERGFNQAFLIADVFAKENNLKLLDDVLIKTKEAKHQADLGYAERQQNIVGSFKVQNKKAVSGKTILIIDDVLTTGATSSACAEVLKKAKAKNVYVLCVAATVYFDKDKQESVKKPKKNVVKIKDFV